VTARTIAAVAALVRLPNGLVAAAAVIVGGRWGGEAWWSSRVALAAASALALTAVANAYNDYQDRDIDVVSHPERPIPSGAISPRLAAGISAVAAVGGVGFALAARPALAVLSLGVVTVMFEYAWIKAWSGLAANVVVAVIGSLPFLYGAWAAGAPRAALPLMALAAPLQFARELAKDVDDVDGDSGRRLTAPLVLGEAATRGIAVAAAVIAVLVLGGIGVRFRPATWVTLLPAGIIVLFGCWRLLRGRSGAPTSFKVAMVLAILGMIPLAP
jgi:geranylgeranylglycerol-phosphate geranylgeranyltransferase